MTGFDDVKLVLGYYDERLSETMVVLNMDYEPYCRYASRSNASMKLTHLHHAWIDGHFFF